MCYDVSFVVVGRELSDYFPDLIFDQQIEIDFNGTAHIMGHSHGLHPIIYRNKDDNKLHCKTMEWGCIPFYTKDIPAYAKQRMNMLNARSERILDDKTSYWFKIRNRRCLIPVTGIYEHRKIDKKGWTKKVPYFVKPKDQEMFFLPGLYSVVEVPDKETGELLKLFTYTMVTTNANRVMKDIHNDGENAGRMPLFLTFELSNKWLDEELDEEGYRGLLDYTMPGDDLYYHPVYTIRSGKERPDGKPKNEYWEWENLPPLGEANPGSSKKDIVK